LFVTSPEAVTAENAGPTLASAVFDHVAVAGTGPAADGLAITSAPAARTSRCAAVQPDRRYFHGARVGGHRARGGQRGGSGRPADHGVIGAFAGLIVVIVVATMFITTEYRRGLIRTTLAATPRRGQVLAAKAAVIGAVAFAAGLAGSAIAVLLGAYMLRGSGFYVFPVGVLTELRVVAGTAAMFALAAVFAWPWARS